MDATVRLLSILQEPQRSRSNLTGAIHLGLRRRSQQDSHDDTVQLAPIHLHPLLQSAHHRVNRDEGTCLGIPHRPQPHQRRSPVPTRAKHHGHFRPRTRRVQRQRRVPRSRSARDLVRLVHTVCCHGRKARAERHDPCATGPHSGIRKRRVGAADAGAWIHNSGEPKQSVGHTCCAEPGRCGKRESVC